jgi:DNA-directed RNA polymerase subunit K/omega
VIQCPPGINAFEYVIISALRAAQLMRGCTPRVVAADKAVVTARREVAQGLVTRLPAEPVDAEA